MAKARKVIITCAVTGSIHTPSMSPYLPVTADEITEAALGAPRPVLRSFICTLVTKKTVAPIRASMRSCVFCPGSSKTPMPW